MSEFGRFQKPNDLRIIEMEIYDSMYSHWHHYFAMPEEKRLGDEDVWEEVLKDAASEVGIKRKTARQLCDDAKDRAINFPELTPLVQVNYEQFHDCE